MKKFSVVIAFYNQMDYIEETLKSVFEQTYDNVEVILADDSSSDFNEKIIKRIVKKYNKKSFDFQIVRNASNQGIVKNCNNGLKNISGEYVLCFAGDDKLYDSKVLSNFANAFKKNKNINVITSQSLSMDVKLQELKDGVFVNSIFAEKMNKSSNKEVYFEMCKNCFYAIGATAFRREVFKKYGLFDEKYKYVEDWPYYLKLLRNGEKILYVDFFTLLHRDGGIAHNDSINPPKHVLEYYKDMKKVYIEEIFKHLLYLNPIRIVCLLFYIFKKYISKSFRIKNNYNDHTFVICAYKESKFLEDCVRSLVSQNVKSRVLISTSTPNDYIYSIADKYKIKVVINNWKKGHSNDFRFAYRQAKTKYVTLCHQDDVYLPNFSKETIKALNKCKNPIIAFTDYYELRNDNLVKYNKLLIVKRIINFPLIFFKKSKRVRLFTLSVGNAICAPTLTYNKEMVEKPVIDTNFKSNIDWISYIDFAKKNGEFVYVRKQLLARRIHEESLTTQVIENNIKHQEDYEIFKMFWSEKIAKRILSLYSKSEESNKIDK